MAKEIKKRPTDLKKYEENYDNIFGRKTWMDWAKEFDEKILDPDGFDRSDSSKKYTLKEFILGLKGCTRTLVVGDLKPMNDGICDHYPCNKKECYLRVVGYGAVECNLCNINYKR